MGAWNRGLFDNDSAMDAVGHLFDTMGIVQYLEDEDGNSIRETGDERDERQRNALNAALPTLDRSDLTGYETVMLSAMLMRLGAALPDDLRSKAIAAVPDAYEEERYFYEEARDDVLAALASYKDGSPWPFAQKGLFETMEEKADMGLINQPPKGMR